MASDSLLTNIFLQDISAVAKAWEDSPYLFIVKVQPLFRGVEDEDIGAEQLNFAFTSERQYYAPVDVGKAKKICTTDDF